VVERSNSYDEIRTEFQRFEQTWTGLARQLQARNSRVLERQARRVSSIVRNLDDLLLIPSDMNRDRVVHLTQLLQQDVDRLVNGITLKTLASLGGNRNQIVDYAAAFYTSCNDFSQLASGGDNRQTLTDVYYYLQDDWQRLRSVSGPVQTGPAGQAFLDL